ncbi:MAG: protein translocase subunit SecD [Candidatus Palauibacterales bacterium]|nr:protein translocase subunit SecD [Candidatus Palauibacterales bacterium]
MFSSIKGRIAVIVGLVLLCGWTLMPQEGPEGNTISPLNLGLDLQGGMHLAVELASDTTLTDQARSDALDRVLTTIRNRVNEFGVREPIIQKVGNERIIVELAGIDNPERAKDIVSQTAFLSFNVVRTDGAVMDRLERIDQAIVDELGAENLRAAGGAGGDLSALFGQGEAGAPDTVAPDTTGADTAAAGAQQGGQGEGGLPPALAGEDTGQAAGQDTSPSPETQGLPGMQQEGGQGGAAQGELRPLSELLLQSGQNGVFLVAEQDVPTVRKFLAMDAVQGMLPNGIQLNWGANTVSQGGNVYRQLYVLADEPLITGEYLADAGPAQRDPTYNQPIVPFEMTRQGARIFERQTSRNVGEQMAIVLDGRVQSAPVIRQTLSRRAQIELGATGSLQEAQDLALVLRAGALPVPIQIVEERTVGPSLGQDSIEQGRMAFIIGIVLVILGMIAYYRMAGAMAVGALCVYVILVLGGLAGLEATLTLPGIAGIILSVGMAVDANVLIFERIREEQAAGKTPRTAVEEGFAHALSAIVDANLTTLITAIILYQVGTGPVQGFAVTLAIGIIASFVTALYVTRTFFMIYLDRHSPTDPVSI